MSEISIIMSTFRRNRSSYDCDNLLKRAIDSILTQTFTDFELLLIDDGSSDGSEAVCREYAAKDSRIRYIRHDDNSGFPAIRYNEGMLLAKSDYFMFMFDDDFLMPHAMADLHKAITGEYKSCGMVYGFCLWNYNGNIRPIGREWDLEWQESNNAVPNLAVIVKREVINVVGGYDETMTFKRACDWDLWLRLGKQFMVGCIKKVVANVSTQTDGLQLNLPNGMADMKKEQSNPNRVFPLVGKLVKPVPVVPVQNNEIITKSLFSSILGKVVFAYNNHDAALVRWALGYLCDGMIKNGVNVSVINIAQKTNDEWAKDVDVLMVYRCFDLRTINIMKKVKKRGKYVMFFLDDYLFQPNCKYTGDWKMAMEPLHEADCLVSSSARLLSHMPDKPKILRRSVLGYEDGQFLQQQYRRTENQFGIGWTASSGRQNMMNDFVFEILRILNGRIPKGMRCIFHSFGNRQYPSFPNIEIRQHPYIEPQLQKKLYEKWVNLDFGVIINPLEEDDEWCHCKSELKFIESGTMGVPLITSRIPPYTEFIKDGENGFLASTPEEYADKLVLLMEDEALSRKVSDNAREYVKTNYDVVANAKQFIADLKNMMEKSIQLRMKKYFGWESIPKKNF